MDSPDNLSLALFQSSEFMKSNGDKFNDFLLILHDELAYKTLVKSLKTEYGEYYYWYIARVKWINYIVHIYISRFLIVQSEIHLLWNHTSIYFSIIFMSMALHAR